MFVNEHPKPNIATLDVFLKPSTINQLKIQIYSIHIKAIFAVPQIDRKSS